MPKPEAASWNASWLQQTGGSVLTVTTMAGNKIYLDFCTQSGHQQYLIHHQ
jgi:hypothetical protein